jgi:hypothetical protein
MLKKEILNKFEKLALEKILREENMNDKKGERVRLEVFEKMKLDKLKFLKPEVEYIVEGFNELYSNKKIKPIAPKRLMIFGNFNSHDGEYQYKKFYFSTYNIWIESPLSFFVSASMKKIDHTPNFKLHKPLPLRLIERFDRREDLSWYQRENKYFSIDEFLENELPFLPDKSHRLYSVISLRHTFEENLENYIKDYEKTLRE